MTYVVGVDGCPGGWLAARYDWQPAGLTFRVHRSFAELLASYPDARAIGVDIPIGLNQNAPRACDIEARKVLGPRKFSVFPAPDARLIEAPEADYPETLALARELTQKGISRQLFGILPKIREVRSLVTREMQDRVFEVHPEVSFWALAGETPMRFAKKGRPGFAERHDRLADALGVEIPDFASARTKAPPASRDDVLDAIVAAWTARRRAEGRAKSLPTVPQRDARKLRMEIVY